MQASNGVFRTIRSRDLLSLLVAINAYQEGDEDEETQAGNPSASECVNQ